MSFSIISELLLSNSNVYIAFALLFMLLAVGILFDVVSVAVTSSSLEPFLAMAAKKIKGARIAVRLIKNAEKVNNICSDVIGDICGIVTGALGASIVLKIFISGGGYDAAIVSILFSSILAALTVGGKAIGKKIAITNDKEIVFLVARLISFFSKK
jgi:CBS domain containing-hemolysin-like protein